MERKTITYGHVHRLSLFNSIPEKRLESLVHDQKITAIQYGSGELLHLEKELCDSIEIVLEGNLSIEQLGEQGEVFTVATIGPGSLIGGNLVFSSSPWYPHTISAIGPCLIVKVGEKTLERLLSEFSGFLRNFLTTISDNTIMVNGRLSDMVNRTLRQRIILYLKAEIVRQKSPMIILPVTKTRLARILGVSRTSLSRELAKMKEDGLVDSDNRKITLLDN